MRKSTRISHSRRAASILTTGGLLVLAQGGAAQAQSTLDDTVSSVVVVGVAAGANVEASAEQGLGKLRAAGHRPSMTADATLVWAADFSERVRAVVAVDFGSDARPVAGLGEAYLKFRPDAGHAWRLSGRAGIFFPPVSLEHDGSEWSLSRTVTPSALNTWIAEEAKTSGIEASLDGVVGDQRVRFTAAAFVGNDTAGKLLAFRGRALHDLRATVAGTFALPDQPAMFVGQQGEKTQPVIEVDGRIGGYGQAEWSLSDTVTLSFFGYDKNGDETSLTDGHYAWNTHFSQAALHWTPYESGDVLVQALMGACNGGASPADVDLVAAYGLVSQEVGTAAATLRADYFAVSYNSFKKLDNNAASVWAVTASWGQPIHAQTELFLEGILLSSDRPDRARFGLDRSQASAQLRIKKRHSETARRRQMGWRGLVGEHLDQAPDHPRRAS